jgi:hypothetical protein
MSSPRPGPGSNTDAKNKNKDNGEGIGTNQDVAQYQSPVYVQVGSSSSGPIYQVYEPETFGPNPDPQKQNKDEVVVDESEEYKPPVYIQKETDTGFEDGGLLYNPNEEVIEVETKSEVDNDDGFFYRPDERACHNEYFGNGKKGRDVLELLRQKTRKYEAFLPLLIMSDDMNPKETAKLDDKPNPKKVLYDAALAAHEALFKLTDQELNQKKYQVAIALAIRALDNPTQANADRLNNYIERSQAGNYPRLKWAIATALVVIAASAFIAAAVFTIGTAPIVAAAVGVGVNAAMVSMLGFGVGSAATAGLIGMGIHSLFKKPTPDEKLADLSQAMKSYTRTR